MSQEEQETRLPLGIGCLSDHDSLIDQNPTPSTPNPEIELLNDTINDICKFMQPLYSTERPSDQRWLELEKAR